MLDVNNPVQWQIRDEKHPVLKPWYTHGLLEEMKSWDLSDKVVLEYGGGWSTLWYALYAKEVYTVETDLQWIYDIIMKGQELGISHKLHIYHRKVNEGDQSMVNFYTRMPKNCKPDVVVVDGVLRHECLQKALMLPRPLRVIHDNWRQDGFLCPASEELMKPYQIHQFIQEDHTDNHGNKWSTAYWDLK